MARKGMQAASSAIERERGWALLRHRVTPGTGRRAWDFAAPYKRRLVLFVAVVIIDAAIGASLPLLFRSIIDRGILRHRSGVVIALALVAGGLAVADGVLTVVQRYIGARVGEGLVFDLRAKVFRHVLSMPLGFFTRTQTGSLLSRLDNDVEGAEVAFTDLLQTSVGNSITVVIVLGAMFALSWRITLVALMAVPLLVVPARLVSRRAAGMTRETYRLLAEMGNVMAERFNVAGALLVMIFGRPDQEAAAFENRARRVRDLGVARAAYARVFASGLVLTASLATAIAYGWGGVLAIHGRLDIGTVVALVAYLARLYFPIASLANIPIDVMAALVSFERLFEILDLAPAIAERPGAIDIPPGPATVRFEEVTFAYPGAAEVSLRSLESLAAPDEGRAGPVLSGIDFAVEPGQIAALVGRSGAGKTTITYLVRRLYDVSSGRVTINGVDVRDASMDSLRASVGMVTQDVHLFHDTIRANLLYARPDATEAELWDALEQCHMGELVASLPSGIDTVVGERGYRLSGGEKQRVALARLLLKAAPVVVLDEATAHLDSESEKAVRRAVRTVLSGRTAIVIAHRLSTVRDADVLLVIDEGRIAERGTHEELIRADGLYAELYRTQFGGQLVD